MIKAVINTQIPLRPICTGIKTVPAPIAIPIHKSTQPKSYFVNGNLVESGVVVALLLFNGNVSSCIEPPAQNIGSSLIKNAAYNQAIVP
ncbi:hypothetical protein LFZ31_03380 [Salmonella enterica subsp. enterica serovar Newport str. S09097]|nr:hypothetical protein LFZ31_03380 [Salmonella enterica subsp. enterica serovar Newport str. S09097]